jgi:hypothetical protein
VEQAIGVARERIEEQVGCAQLIIRVRDEHGNPLSGYEAEFLVQGGPSFGKWELDENGQKTVHLRMTNIVSYVILKGPNFKTSARLKDGLRKDTEVLFVFNRCPHKPDVATPIE